MPAHEGHMIECRNCTSTAVSATSPPEPPLSLSLTERLKSRRCQPATGSLWRSRSNNSSLPSRCEYSRFNLAPCAVLSLRDVGCRFLLGNDALYIQFVDSRK